ncbi:hypothetical protein DUZ99_17195 [Xylanibacillus composti]|uniref:Glycosyl transferase family 2 n=1 Tax=Xylanibacillus composti TaxID=1572762 RepID=A0A8J4H624_9BACL|nr:glycosyltransferase family 2 protein [Xylanibacillus composti]MDT9726715.1 hypothetical protein [Xylanibacillus composti]GIQ69353.1 glycosyl transferase family 2 [Xylanibacillus composti]
MNIVIPIAGEGRRFRHAGFRLPKVMLETAGKPMLYWALDSLQPLLADHRVIFVCLSRDLQAYSLDQTILDYCPHADILGLDAPTRGQAESVWAARTILDKDEPLLIYNGDTYTKIDERSLLGFHQDDGMIPVFRSSDPAFSYVLTNGDGKVVQVREKEVISAWATTGLYGFSRTELFLAAAEKALAEQRKADGEYYVAPLYNDLIGQGYSFRIEPVKLCLPIGTPEQWRYFQSVIHSGKGEGGR